MKKRIVIKIGSSSITTNGLLNFRVMRSIAYQTALLFKLGFEIVIVSSGAVVCGRQVLTKRNNFSSQTAAIYGQNVLLNAWTKEFVRHNISVGQVLISESDLRNSNTPIIKSLRYGIQIINANDAVNDEEMKAYFLSSDNDKLAGHIAKFIKADILMLLTNVDGVLDSKGKVMHRVDKKLNIILEGKSSVGTGGMQSKVTVGLDSSKNGIKTYIANANTRDVIIKILSGEQIGTMFI